MSQRFAEPDEANLDHLMFSDDPLISAFARWLVQESEPDDWHLVVEGWDWDRGEDPLWWIVTRPNCDRATALMVFWGTKPYHYLGLPGWPIDFAAHRQRFGPAVDAVMPPSMRYLSGRRLSNMDFVDGIPTRFWDVDEPFDEEDDEA